jgi:hypothetical protein
MQNETSEAPTKTLSVRLLAYINDLSASGGFSCPFTSTTGIKEQAAFMRAERLPTMAETVTHSVVAGTMVSLATCCPLRVMQGWSCILITTKEWGPAFAQ